MFILKHNKSGYRQTLDQQEQEKPDNLGSLKGEILRKQHI